MARTRGIVADGLWRRRAARSRQYDEHAEGAHADVAIIDAKTAAEMGVRTAKTGPGVVRDAHEVQGLLTPIEGKHARVRARYPGPVQAVRVGVGDVVKAGQTLALVESNASLTAYAVTAPFAGTVLDVAAGPGDLAGDAPLFESRTCRRCGWTCTCSAATRSTSRPGSAGGDHPPERWRCRRRRQLDRILPGTATASQSTVARATIRNADGQWRPGSAVRARVTVGRAAGGARRARLGAAELSRVTRWCSSAYGDTYEARPVKLGERDADERRSARRA